MNGSARRRPVRVAVIGLGTVGRRIAAAVSRQSDMELAGIGIRRETPFSFLARRAGASIFSTGAHAAAGPVWELEGAQGGLGDLLGRSDVVADVRQAGLGATLLDEYRSAGIPVVFQGGERAADVELTFSSFVNYELASGKNVVRLTSCNTTGLARLLSTLHREYGVTRADAVLVRCSTDPDKANHGMINGALVTLGESHHGPDLRAIFPGLELSTTSIAVPMSQRHVQALTVQLRTPTHAREIEQLLCRTPRIVTIDRSSANTTNGVAEQFAYDAADSLRTFGDAPELLVWSASIRYEDGVLRLCTAVDMQSITVPETIDCIRRMFSPDLSRSECVRATDAALGLWRNGTSYAQIGLPAVSGAGALT
jgi:glyceraldehyde-3-phosphate dehydrogenase (NAD(P))